MKIISDEFANRIETTLSEANITIPDDAEFYISSISTESGRVEYVEFTTGSTVQEKVMPNSRVVRIEVNINYGADKV